MKKLILFASIILFFFASCDRDMVFDTISVTSPELHVFVRNVDGNAVNGATVTIFKSMDDLTNSSNQIASANTDNEGKAVFTKNELKDPGKFYVKAVSNDLSASKETPYMLLNDGHTYVNITLQ